MSSPKRNDSADCQGRRSQDARCGSTSPGERVPGPGRAIRPVTSGWWEERFKEVSAELYAHTRELLTLTSQSEGGRFSRRSEPMGSPWGGTAPGESGGAWW